MSQCSSSGKCKRIGCKRDLHKELADPEEEPTTLNAACQRALNLGAVTMVEAQRYRSRGVSVQYVDVEGTHRLWKQ